MTVVELPLASVNGVVEEFLDLESAKRSGRTAFMAMLEYLKRHSSDVSNDPVEKTDQGNQ
jgi:hypothetical protein